MGLQPQGRRTTPIAHLLTIDSWSRRRKIVERVRAACTVVSAVDHRYDLTVEAAISDRGNYVLHCRRSSPAPRQRLIARSHPRSARRGTRRLPSAPVGQQVEILRGLVAEWGVTPVVDALSAAAGAADPFADSLAGWPSGASTGKCLGGEQGRRDQHRPDVLQKIRDGVVRRAAGRLGEPPQRGTWRPDQHRRAARRAAMSPAGDPCTWRGALSRSRDEMVTEG